MDSQSHQQQPVVGLEDQLRSMIIANQVPASPTTSNPVAPPPGIPVNAQHQRNVAQFQKGRSQNNAQYPSQQQLGQTNAFVPRGQRQTAPSRTQSNFETQKRTQPKQSNAAPQAPVQALSRNKQQQPNNAQQQVRQSAPGHGQGPSVQARPMRPVRQHEGTETMKAQGEFLEGISAAHLPRLQMTAEEYATKDAFRTNIEQTCRVALQQLDANANLHLEPFGSFASTFCNPGSDMDLALLLSKEVEGNVGRALEKALLNSGFGAHLLTKTRVPILKVCEKPSEELYTALQEERKRWDEMSPEERFNYDTGHNVEIKKNVTHAGTDEGGHKSTTTRKERSQTNTRQPLQSKEKEADKESSSRQTEEARANNADNASAQTVHVRSNEVPNKEQEKTHRAPKPWFREKRPGPLDFPKGGVGVQCDINFDNPLGIHNTKLLRCYSHIDVRVQMMVLFVKAWASRRKINSSRWGTLSSYGYVLMVLHFLVNICRPPICPNLQLAKRSNKPWRQPIGAESGRYDLYFWDNEDELRSLAQKGLLTHNKEPLGSLLRSFFLYYAKQGWEVPAGGFNWTSQVLSLRTPGGILTKQAKGWTGAKTTMQEQVEVRNRYLLAIEDPFELDHNVARVVTHNGIVAIRDEFRRAWRIIVQAGNGQVPEDDLMANLESLPPLQETSPKSGVVQDAPEDQPLE